MTDTLKTTHTTPLRHSSAESMPPHKRESEREENWVFIAIFVQIMMHLIRLADWTGNSTCQGNFLSLLKMFSHWLGKIKQLSTNGSAADGNARHFNFMIDKEGKNLELGKAEGKRVILKNNFSNLEALKAQYLCAQI